MHLYGDNTHIYICSLDTPCELQNQESICPHAILLRCLRDIANLICPKSNHRCPLPDTTAPPAIFPHSVNEQVTLLVVQTHFTQTGLPTIPQKGQSYSCHRVCVPAVPSIRTTVPLILCHSRTYLSFCWSNVVLSTKLSDHCAENYCPHHHSPLPSLNFSMQYF